MDGSYFLLLTGKHRNPQGQLLPHRRDLVVAVNLRSGHDSFEVALMLQAALELDPAGDEAGFGC